MFKFGFHGGVWKPSNHSTEKFLLFSVVKGEEHALYEMQRIGLVRPDATVDADNLPDKVAACLRDGLAVDPQLLEIYAKYFFLSHHPLVKVFVFRADGAAPPQRASFYIRLLEGGGEEVRIYPFSGPDSEKFFRSAHAVVLPPKDAIVFVQPGTPSARYLEEDIRNPIPGLLRDQLVKTTISIKPGRGAIRHVRL